MSFNYESVADMPTILPVFPLSGALLLPGGQMPLNIFEPRYIAMVDEALRGHRLIGMVQPEDSDSRGAPPLYDLGCVGKITSFSDTGDGRYLITLTGIARYRIGEELTAMTPYRQCSVDFTAFAQDFQPDSTGEDVDRAGLLRTLRSFAEAHGLSVDWKGIDDAPNDTLVNALSMISPFGPREKQALLAANDLKTRADVLIAIAEIELARGDSGSQRLQ